MNINFVVNPIFTGKEPGFSPWDTRLGGSEEMVVETSKRLAKHHKVQVFHNGKHGEYEGVKYRDHSEYEPGDITINMNYPEFESSGRQILWTSLTNHPDLSKFEAVCAISQYALDNTNIIHANRFIVPPGYDDTKIYPDEKIPKQCFYASSPDRGLDVLLEAWPRVHEAHPDATLLVTYGATSDLPGVIGLGECNEETVDELYRTSDIWCHPCTGVELYCMVGKKAQISGCIPVVIPAMALAETVRRGFKVQDKKDYAKTLIEVLDYDMKFRDIMRKEIIREANATTWDETTGKLLEIVKKVLKSN